MFQEPELTKASLLLVTTGPTWMLTAAHCILNFAGNGYLSGAPAGNTRVVYGCLDVRSADCM